MKTSIVACFAILVGSATVLAAGKNTANERLFEAIKKRSTAAVSEAVRAGANLNDARDALDRSPLLAAASSQSIEVFQHLLNVGANPNDPADRNGNSVVGALVHPDSHAFLELYLRFGGEINVMVLDLLGDSRPYLSLVAARNRVDLCHAALKGGADVRKLDSRGWTALMNAVDNGRFRTAYQLLVWKAVVPEIDLAPEHAQEMLRKAEAEKAYEAYWTTAFIAEFKKQLEASR